MEKICVGWLWTVRFALSGDEAPWEREFMLKGKNVVAALRRDVSFVWHAVIVLMFIGFASLAVAAALLDLMSLRH
jgi:hypothetical protein